MVDAILSPPNARKNTMSNIKKYKRSILSHIGDNDSKLFLYWKARVGLFALLKSIDIKEGDEIILPAYTCVVVANAILYLGAKPVYVDINPDTFNMDVTQVKSAITNKTKVIICQNTYGLSTDLELLQEIAKEYKLYTIEDCTHGFGGSYNGTPNGLSCDAAIYSTQWNKPFSTGIGGFVITKNKELSEKLSHLEVGLSQPRTNELLKLKLLYFVKRYLINSYNYWAMIHFYRWLSHNTPLVVGSSSSEEIKSITRPKAYFKAFSEVQAKEGNRTISNLEDNIAIRKKNALTYTHLLQNLGKNHVDEKWFKNHSFLKYPLLVKDRDEFMVLAEKNRINLGEWFTSPLHPVMGDLTPWNMDINLYPQAKYLSSHVVNLPTSTKNLDHVIVFLNQYSDLIIDA